MPFDLNSLLRPNIRVLTPYSSARHEFSGEASVFLDANENSLGSPLPQAFHRYPDPNQTALKIEIGRLKGIDPEQIFLGNGSDEAIDLLYRMCCDPGDSALICPPTYGMYSVSAAIHATELICVPLLEDFNLDIPAILAAIRPKTKLLFICSPNNPSGNSMKEMDIRTLLEAFNGLVVVDEAYIDFSTQPSWIGQLERYPNLVVLQTFSKAWGLAGLRVGMAFASREFMSVINKVKAPYNLSDAVQQLVLDALKNKGQVKQSTFVLLSERDRLEQEFAAIPCVLQVYPSDANFLLLKVTDAKAIYRYLVEKGIVVRDRSNVKLCDNCLRITVGTPEENTVLLERMRQYGA